MCQDELRGGGKSSELRGLLRYASSFDVVWSEEIEAATTPDFNPHLCVANNLLCRGLPTRTPLLVEEMLQAIRLIEPNRADHKFDFAEHSTEFDLTTLKDLLHFLEPGRNVGRSEYGGELGSDFEWDFLNEQLAAWPFAKQILQPQRDFASINGNMTGGKTVDFAYAYPGYAHVDGSPFGSKTVGVVLEVDGPHHDTFLYRSYDWYRDDAAAESGFATIRTPGLHDEAATDQLTQLFAQAHFDSYRRNFTRSAEDDLPIYTLVLLPLVVARIQRVLIEWLLHHPEIYSRGEVFIAVIERDLPGAALAVQHLQQLLEHLAALTISAARPHVPRLQLDVFPEQGWTYDNRLHLNKPLLTEGDFLLDE